MASTPLDRCAFCNARNTGLVCSLNSDSHGRIRGETTTHLFHRGQLIFYAGAPAHALYVIRSGRVKVFRTSRAGDEQVLRLLGPGEIVGFRPLLAGDSYRASAEAVEEASVCILPAATLRELLRELPELALELLAKLARELSQSEDLMMSLLHRPVRERAARVLLLLREDNRGAPEPERLESRHLRRQDMARMIGTTPETFSRVLRGFAHRGAIELTRDSLRIRNLALLQEIAGGDLGQ
jgi:CRP-like cAMP-binding protein